MGIWVVAIRSYIFDDGDILIQIGDIISKIDAFLIEMLRIGFGHGDFLIEMGKTLVSIGRNAFGHGFCLIKIGGFLSKIVHLKFESLRFPIRVDGEYKTGKERVSQEGTFLGKVSNGVNSPGFVTTVYFLTLRKGCRVAIHWRIMFTVKR